MKKFSEWLIEQEGDRIEDAILGIVSGGDPTLGEEERNHLMGRSTTEFGADIQERLRDLGIIANIANDDMARYQDIIQGIKHGMTIKDLVDKVRGTIDPVQ
jgi:hypothetical protein